MQVGTYGTHDTICNYSLPVIATVVDGMLPSDTPLPGVTTILAMKFSEVSLISSDTMVKLIHCLSLAPDPKVTEKGPPE